MTAHLTKEQEERFDGKFKKITGNDRLGEHWITGLKGIEEYELVDVKQQMAEEIERAVELERLKIAKDMKNAFEAQGRNLETLDGFMNWSRE
ncbi:MAG TPA: hypothetical protein VD999_05665 [Vitreimonas sp.]|nr:hypothetical protein [Vitreimonas sp.]